MPIDLVLAAVVVALCGGTRHFEAPVHDADLSIHLAFDDDIDGPICHTQEVHFLQLAVRATGVRAEVNDASNASAHKTFPQEQDEPSGEVLTPSTSAPLQLQKEEDLPSEEVLAPSTSAPLQAEEGTLEEALAPLTSARVQQVEDEDPPSEGVLTPLPSAPLQLEEEEEEDPWDSLDDWEALSDEDLVGDADAVAEEAMLDWDAAGDEGGDEEVEEEEEDVEEGEPSDAELASELSEMSELLLGAAGGAEGAGNQSLVVPMAQWRHRKMPPKCLRPAFCWMAWTACEFVFDPARAICFSTVEVATVIVEASIVFASQGSALLLPASCLLHKALRWVAKQVCVEMLRPILGKPVGEATGMCMSHLGTRFPSSFGSCCTTSVRRRRATGYCKSRRRRQFMEDQFNKWRHKVQDRRKRR